MPSVHASTQTALTSDSTALRGSDHGVKQRWLKTLEAAGWRDALREAKTFATPDRSGIEADTGERDAPTQGMSGGDDTPENSRHTGNPRTSYCKAENESQTPPQNANTQGARGRSANPEVSVAGFAPLSRKSQDGNGKNDFPIQTARQQASEMQPRNWLARNISVLQSGPGLELWIRDSTMTRSGLVGLLADLRASMAEMGSSLVRVSLNGKSLYPLLSGKPENTISKEEQTWPSM